MMTNGPIHGVMPIHGVYIKKFDLEQARKALKEIKVDGDINKDFTQATKFVDEYCTDINQASNIQIFITNEVNKHFNFDDDKDKVKKEGGTQLKKYFKEKIKEVKAEIEQKEKEAKKEAFKIRIQTHMDDMFHQDIPKNVNKEITAWDEYKLPKGTDYSYTMDDDGISVTVQLFTKDGDIHEQLFEVSRTPFILSGKTEQLVDGSVFYTLRYKNHGTQKEVMVKKTELQPLNRLKETLSKYDINVTDDMSKRAEEYISKYLAVFGNNLFTVEANSANGWNKDCTKFYCGNWSITEEGLNPIHTTIETSKLVAPFHRAGTLNGWVKAVTPAMEYSVSRFVFYEGMCAPLRKIIGVNESQMTVISGNTSSGKSALNHMVGSGMGQPNNRQGAEGLEFPVGDSPNPLVAHAAGMSDMVVNFEEATGEEKAKLMVKCGYDIVNGTEKIRNQVNGKNRNDVRSMQVQVIVTCERPLREYSKHAGAQYRINDIKGEDLIPPGNGKLVDDLKKGIYENYGWFFPIYIQKIIKNKKRIKEMYEQALQKIESDFKDIPEESRNTVGRAKLSFALKIVAGYLCEEVFNEIGVPAKTDKEVEDIVNYFFQKSVLGSPVEPDWKRALEYTSDVIVSERSKFYTSDSNQKEMLFGPANKNECYGNLYDVRAEIIGTKLTEILKKGVFPAAIKREWENMGILSKYGKISVGKKGELQQVNGYTLNIKKMSEYLNIEWNENLNEREESSHTKLDQLADAIDFIKKNVSPEDIDLLFNGSLSDYSRITAKLMNPTKPTLSNAPLNEIDTEYGDNIQHEPKKEQVIKEQEEQREKEKARRQEIREKKEYNKEKELEKNRVNYQKKESGNNSVTA